MRSLGQRALGRVAPLTLALLTRLPVDLLVAVEELAQEAQGKGWGAGTVGPEVKAALALLPPERRQRPHVLDVGANVGDWTAGLLAVAPGATVDSFEPSADARTRLEERFGDDRRVTIIASAVGRIAGMATLWSDTPGSSLASLTRRDLSHHSLTFGHAETVSVTTLDDWARGTGRQPDLIKLDVEGHELDVLSGGSETLRTVRVIQFEFGGCNIDTRTYFRDFWGVLTEAGFQLARVTPRGAVDLGAYRESHEIFRTTNFLAYRPAV